MVALAVGACTCLSYWHLSEWRYYLLMLVTLATALYVAWPVRRPSSWQPAFVST